MPGLVFESMVIGGGYATGRELVEFFLRHGPARGIARSHCYVDRLEHRAGHHVRVRAHQLAATTTVRSSCTWSTAWVVYDLLYYAMLVLVLSVIGAACSSVFREVFGLPGWLGAAVLMGFVAVLVYFGNVMVERVLSAWGIALYMLYGGDA